MNQTVRFIRGQFFLTFVFLTSTFITILQGLPFYSFIKIAELKNYSIDQKRDIYSTFDAENKNQEGLPIDPFDLMNRLKKAGAMSDATTPSDALDEALNAFNESEYENDPIE